MTKQNIKQLAKLISQKDKIDQKSADMILKNLTRGELIVFVQYLKSLFNKNTVKIISEKPIEPEIKNILIKKFSGKKIIFEKDEVGDGIRVLYNDTVVDLTLAGFAENLLDNLKTTN